MAQLNFNANNVAPSDSFDLIPAGKYPMMFVDSEMKPTSAGTGSYLQLTAEIIEGEFKARKVWARLNLDNPNATAVEIAQRDLSAICRAVGVMQPGDSAELHNIPFIGVLKIRPAKGDFDASNEFKGYEPMAGALTAANDSDQPAAAAAGAAGPAWKR